MLSPDKAELSAALQDLADLFATAKAKGLGDNELFKACEEIIKNPRNDGKGYILHFYCGVQCFVAENLFHALVHMINCLQLDLAGRFSLLCKPYIDFIEDQKKDDQNFGHNIGILYAHPYLRKRSALYARTLRLRSFRSGDAYALASFGYDFLHGSDIKQSDHIAYGLFKASTKSEETSGGIRGLLLCKVLGITAVGKDGLLPDYEKLAETDSQWIAPFIIRACLGFRGEKDLVASSRLATESARKGDLSSQLLHNALSNPDFQDFLAGDPLASRMVNEYGWNERPTSYTLNKLERSKARNIGILTAVLAQQAQTESHTYEYEWTTIAARAGCVYWNLPYRRVLENSLAIGQRLQPTTKLGIPIARWPSSATRATLRPPQGDGFTLHVRDKEIKCVVGRFKAHRRLYHPELFDRDDLLVAMALAFAGDKAEFPWFSIESYGKGFVEERLIPIRSRVYGPKWLAATSIGDALYLADQMMPTFGIGCLFSWKDFFHNARFELRQHFSDFYREIENSGGATPFSIGRNSINSKGVTPRVSVARPWWYFGRSIETYALENMQMFFDASYIYYDTNRKEQRNGFPNDPATKLGHCAAIGSQRYEELARAFPVFARVRLFLMVAATLASIRTDRRYEASPALRRKLQKLRDRYAARSPEAFPIFRSYANVPRLSKDET